MKQPIITIIAAIVFTLVGVQETAAQTQSAPILTVSNVTDTNALISWTAPTDTSTYTLKLFLHGSNNILEVSAEQKGRKDAWYSLDGIRLSEKPTQRGLYINNGKKVLIK